MSNMKPFDDKDREQKRLVSILTTILCFALFPALFFGCTGKSGPIQLEGVTVKQHIVPLIKGTPNHVLEMVLDLEKDQILNEVHLNIEGTEVLEKVELYQSVQNGDQAEKKQLYTTSEMTDALRVPVDKTLEAGQHHFWITVRPKETADLTKKTIIHISEIKLDNIAIAPIYEQKPQALRLATKLRHHGDDSIHSFRIPGLVTTAKGTLIAVYDARRDKSGDLQGDIDVGMSRSTDGGKTWEPMKIIMDMGEYGGKPEPENGIGDPAILVDPETNFVYVMALWAHGRPDQALWNSSGSGIEPEETGQLMLVKSEDDGITWSDPVNITKQIKKREWKLMFNGPGKGITMQDGTLVFAGQYKDEADMPYSTIIYSKDKGGTWQIGTGAKDNTTEAQVVELNDGSLMLNMRDNRGGARSVSITTDMGKTWTSHPSSGSALPEPVCMGSLITYPENRMEENASWLFFSNPAATDDRYNITIKASNDQGVTWPEVYHVLLDSQKGWGYSCLTVIDENHLGILYESSQANMTFQVIPVREIIGE